MAGGRARRRTEADRKDARSDGGDSDRPAILVVSRDADDLAVVGHEVRKRYAGHYDVLKPAPPHKPASGWQRPP